MNDELMLKMPVRDLIMLLECGTPLEIISEEQVKALFRGFADGYSVDGEMEFKNKVRSQVMTGFKEVYDIWDEAVEEMSGSYPWGSDKAPHVSSVDPDDFVDILKDMEVCKNEIGN